MTGFFALLRLQLLSRFANLKPRNLKAQMKEKKGRTVGFIILYLVLLAYLAGFLYFVENKVLDVLIQARMPDLLLSMAVMLSMVGTLIISFFFIMSSLYFGRDAAYIAALPVKSRTVLSAKLCQVWLSETGISALIILPACILYSVKVGVEPLFFVRMILVWLFISVLPICLVSFISSGLIRLSALWKKREMITTVSGILFLVLYMFAAGRIGGLAGDSASGGDMIAQMMQDNSERIKALTRSFPPAAWAAEGLMGDWGKLALFIFVCAASAALVVWLLGYVYRKLSLLQTETPASSSRKGAGKISFGGGSAFRACCQREIRQILRVPSYATNILPISVMPVVMVIMMYMIAGSNVKEEGENLQMLLKQLSPVLVLSVLTAVMSYISGMNPALSTAVTREGKGHEMLTALPVPFRTLVLAKMAVGFGLSLMGILLAGIVIAVIFPAFWECAILAVVLCALFTFLNACLSLMRDIKKPRLDWVTEQEAVKQSFGVLIAMLISWAILIALGALTYLLITLKFELLPYFGTMAGLLLVLDVIAYRLLLRTADTKYCQG